MYRQDHGMPKSVLLSVIAVGHLRISVAVVHLKAGTGVQCHRPMWTCSPSTLSARTEFSACSLLRYGRARLSRP
jgi:hypothetical protein